ncbi:MAG: hypothetical protein ACMG6E_00995 [Candidatus Roizmanbacteria bacterium]
MKKIKEITDDEMISVFLKTEISSNRWSKAIIDLLEKDQKDRAIVDNPNLTSREENNYRKKLLGNFRGYGKNDLLFSNFPHDVRWIRARLSKEELKEVKYINYGYWNELSKYTRLPKVGAETILSGERIFDQSNDGFIKAAAAIKKGVKFPEMILVSTDEKSNLVVLEGHLRITAYFLVPDYIPDGLEVIIGYSKDMSRWDSF